MILRNLKIAENTEKNKVLIIYGPRQVGKTTLVLEYLKNYTNKYIWKTGDDIPFSNDLSQCSLDLLRQKIPNGILLVIDEAQKIQNIGRALKLIVDNIDDVTVIVTGSSSFDLLNYTGEALTGRKHVSTLYPIAVQELLTFLTPNELDNTLTDYMIYGMYPNVVNETTIDKKIQKINEITNSYLLKDILDFDKVKNSRKIFNLLKLLAFQIGSEVSTNELARSLGIDKNTVAQYLDLLEKSFILFRLDGFSRNLRKEIKKMSKYYFYDLGVRNSLINNFNKIDTRNDIGQLWENFLIMERIKRNHYNDHFTNYYFWRTYDKKKIDLVEEHSGKLYGYEFKWSKKKIKAPKDWLETYDNASYEIINKENYLDFLK